MSFVWFRGLSQTIGLDCDHPKRHLTRRDRTTCGTDWCRVFPASSSPTTTIPPILIIRLDVLSSLSFIDVKPHPKRFQETSFPEPQWATSLTIETLGGRVMAAEPKYHLKTLRGELLRGELLSLCFRLGDG
jgi:hypothetical protein